MLARSYTQLSESEHTHTHRHTQRERERERERERGMNCRHFMFKLVNKLLGVGAHTCGPLLLLLNHIMYITPLGD